MKRWNVLITAVLAMIVLTALPSPGYGDMIRGCYQKNNGQLRILTDGGVCRPSEIPISWPGLPGSANVVVDCGRGDTISEALQQLDGPGTIEVIGACSENVQITRDDVTILGEPSSSINGPDPNAPAVLIRGIRTVIDGLTVSGGSNGIYVASQATIQNCTVKNSRTGIHFSLGSTGTVDHCFVQNNELNGIHIESGSAMVTNSTITANNSVGIKIIGGYGKVGIDRRMQYAGNAITNNAAGGIQITEGGSAMIGGNTITGNGAVPQFTQFGIGVSYSSADIVGYNIIANNAGRGIWSLASNVQVGNRGFPLPTTGAHANVITGNGSLLSVGNGGITASLGSSLSIWNATVDQNVGNGVALDGRSVASILGGSISNNTVNGIQVGSGGGLFLQDPAVTVTGNNQFGLQCFGGECSYGGNTSGISGNTMGDVSGGCTGF